MTQSMPLPQAMELAVQHQRAGRLREAEAIYLQILAAHPNHPDALNLMGLISLADNQPVLAEQYLREAVAVSPKVSEYHANLGMALARLNRLDAAVASWQKAVQLKPDSPEIHNNLGSAYLRNGDPDRAIAAYGQALACRPNMPEAHYNLGVALRAAGQAEAAIASYRRAIALRPNYVEALINLADALIAGRKFDEAIAIHQSLIANNPNIAELHFNLGNALHAAQRHTEAVEAYRKALAIKPDFTAARANLANAQRSVGDFDSAHATVQGWLDAHPSSPHALAAKGNIFHDQRRLPEAIAAYRQAIELAPEHAPAHFNLSHSLLLSGDFEAGWKEFEWRFQAVGRDRSPAKPDQPLWNGEPLDGKRILIQSEQGFGDTIQFIRYIPQVAAMKAKVVVECHPSLLKLLSTSQGVHQAIAVGSKRPDFDLYCPLLSLPRIFGTTALTIPAPIPYIKADEKIVARWRDRLSEFKARFKVGLAWSGRSSHTNNRNRSIDLRALTMLATVKAAAFISLQKNPPPMSVEVSGASSPFVDWTAGLTDFSQTAGLIASLDLIIAVDTAVAHLAGAMGKPVWLLLPFVPDWRWLLNRNDSPWYPTMRLFRQVAAGDWGGPIQRVNEELGRLVAKTLV